MKGTTSFLFMLIILFLGFSYVFSATALPTSRSLKSFVKDSVHDLLPQGGVEMRNNSEDEEMIDVEEGGYIQGRMMEMETNDYPGTGPNPRHDPPPPSRA